MLCSKQSPIIFLQEQQAMKIKNLQQVVMYCSSRTAKLQGIQRLLLSLYILSIIQSILHTVHSVETAQEDIFSLIVLIVVLQIQYFKLIVVILYRCRSFHKARHRLHLHLGTLILMSQLASSQLNRKDSQLPRLNLAVKS